jgi:glycosyltransferase involved in cell wall biosynthesis
LISIIIPCFNRAKLLEETLNSIIAQSYQNWECIMIDDGSTDNTIDILNQYILKDSRIKYYCRPKNINKGATACRNFGYKHSIGDFVCWFDSDDIMPENSLLDRFNILNTSDYDFVLGKMMNFYDDVFVLFDEKKSLLYPLTDNAASEYIIGKFWFQTSIPLFKKSFLNKFKKHFDEDLTFHDEAEFYVRILLSSPNFVSVESVVTLRRMHSNSLRVSVNSIEISKKILFDQYGYYKIWFAFKSNPKFYDNNIKNFFKYYFKEWMLKSSFNSNRLILLYIQGLRYNMFDCNIKMTKIFLWRMINKK